jgi:hypothetical protein
MKTNFYKLIIIVTISVTSLTSCMNTNQNNSDKKLPDDFLEKFNKHEQEMYKNADTTNYQPTKTLEVGDKIELFGGYDYDPLYLKNPPSSTRSGIVTKFITGQNKSLAAVVKLDNKISGDSITGDIVVLELRYEGQNWFTLGPVHIELCNFEPDNKSWKDRPKGEWVEAAASFRIVK